MGTITDSESGLPIAKVQVFLIGTGFGGLTHDDGSFALKDIPPGAYVLRADRVGLSDVRKPVTVLAGGKIDVSFELETVPIPVEGIVIKGSSGG